MSAISEMIARVEKRFGKEAISRGYAAVPTFSSGSLNLDVILGGGYAEGRIIEIYGGFSAGKSTIAIHAAVEIQKSGRAVGMVDSENAIDPDYMKALGLDLSEEKFVLSQPDNAEEALEIVREMVSTEGIGLVIIDSIAGLTPKATLQGEAGDAKVALLARLLSAQLNILKNICQKNKCTLLCINQTRNTVGGGFGFGGASSTTPGGQALKFYATQRLEMARIGSDKEGEETVANRVKITCKKNKIAPPFKKCEVIIRFGIGFDKVQETLEWAIKYGICQKKGAFYSYEDTRLGQGLPKTRQTLEDNPELYQEIYDNVILCKEADDNPDLIPPTPMEEEE